MASTGSSSIRRIGPALIDRMRSLGDDAVARRMGAQAYERYWSDPQNAARHTNDLLSAYRAMMPGCDAAPGDHAADPCRVIWARGQIRERAYGNSSGTVITSPGCSFPARSTCHSCACPSFVRNTEISLLSARTVKPPAIATADKILRSAAGRILAWLIDLAKDEERPVLG